MFSLPLSPPHRSTFFVASHPRSSLFRSHAPQTPSPLRTLRNANLMPNSTPSPRDNNSLLKSSPLGKFGNEGDAIGCHDENNAGGGSNGAGYEIRETPIGKVRDVSEHDAALITPPDSGSNSQSFTNLKSVPPFSFAFEQETIVQVRQRPSGWETRARSASPAAALVRHAAQGREKKKTQFLDRIRRQRDDSRSQIYSDQVLRMDFVRQRKQWEDQMRRRASLETGLGDANVGGDIDGDADMQQGPEQESLSPTEEHEVEELVKFYEETQRRLPDGESDEFVVEDDDEYDQLFREIISQGQNEISNQHPTARETQQITEANESQLQQQHHREQGMYEPNMDLS